MIWTPILPITQDVASNKQCDANLYSEEKRLAAWALGGLLAFLGWLSLIATLSS